MVDPITVGKKVEILPGEVLQLFNNAAEMRTQARHLSNGWLFRYMRAHKDSHQVLRTIITRSHAS